MTGNHLRPLLMLNLMLAMPSAFGHATPQAVDHAWNFEPEIVLPLLLTVIAYAAGIRHLQDQGISHRIVSPDRIAAFVLGMMALVTALISPLDWLSKFLFSAHMTQHLMLMLVAPPLLILGRMNKVLLWTFPLSLRYLIGQFWRKTVRLRFVFDLLSRPVSVWLLASAVLWFWHISGPYSWAFNNSGIHILEHLSFFLTSLALWSLFLRPFNRKRSGHGTALMLLVTFMLESSLLGALLVFANHPFYIVHTIELPQFQTDIAPLQDQQLAGLIMWVPAGFVQMLASVAVFANLLSISQSQHSDSFRS